MSDLCELMHELFGAVNLLRPISINAQLNRALENNVNLTKRTLFVELFVSKQAAQGAWQGVTMTELAKTLDVSKPAMTKIVDELEAIDLIKRTEDKDDRRNTYIVFTDKGEEKVQKIIDEIKEVLSALIERVGEEGIRNFVEFTKSFYEVLCVYAEQHEEEHAFVI